MVHKQDMHIVAFLVGRTKYSCYNCPSCTGAYISQRLRV